MPVRHVLDLKRRDGWREIASQPLLYIIKKSATLRALSPICPHLGGRWHGPVRPRAERVCDHPMVGREVRQRSAAATASYAWPVGLRLHEHASLAGRAGGGDDVGARDEQRRIAGVGSETFEREVQIDSVRVMLGVPWTC